MQLFLLVFGLTAHALALDPTDASPTSLLERISGAGEAQPDGYTTRPEVVKPADFSNEKPLPALTGPFEKEEEEEVRANGVSHKIITTSGSGTSAFFCAHNRPEPVLDVLSAPGLLGVAAGVATTPRHILHQVFRI